ncbi:MAG: hypothetical protein AUJ49_12305 [Desulfovibrionaceae bacterium CG1_02_65_16]|nr:MAG: hypothetical protein AUJ49_12305 [Desulfovibrionaceae bacterium CG1_02_65_16]
MSHAPFSTRRTLWALALAALLALGACAPQNNLPQYDLPRPDLEAFRTRFIEPALPASGLAVRASLLYSTPTRANRTDVQLYGEYARPLRMDVRAGIGTMLALMREDSAGLLAFYPDKSRAYAHSDPVIGAQLLGLPFPFSLRDLAMVISGHFESLVPGEPDSIRVLPRGGFAFSYNQGPVRLLVLDQYGRPESMEGPLSKYFRTQAERDGQPVSGKREWTLKFAAYPEDDGDPAGPARRLILLLPKGDSAVLRVRAVEPRQSWAEKSLALALPAGAHFMSLESRPAPVTASDVITGGGDNAEQGHENAKPGSAS